MVLCRLQCGANQVSLNHGIVKAGKDASDHLVQLLTHSHHALMLCVHSPVPQAVFSAHQPEVPVLINIGSIKR